MPLPISLDTLVNFLLAAKRNAYPAQGDEASVTPLLAGARQLEFQDDQLLYRDSYFGFAYFVGQETVYFAQTPLWAMGYAGGLLSSHASPDETGWVSGFLQAALRRVEPERPYRGPSLYRDGTYAYSDESDGDVTAF